MLRTGIVPALLVLVLSFSLASIADARKGRSRYSSDHGYSARSDDNEGRRAMATEGAVGARTGSGGGAFGAVVEQLVRGCAQRGTDLVNWPFDDIARIADPDELQRPALHALRGAAKEAAERLASDCPQQVPAAPSARLEAVEQGIDVALAAFAKLQPVLQAFYGALDDEQKARLLRDMTMSAAPARSAERTRERSRERAYQRSDERSSGERPERRSRLRAHAQGGRQAAGGTEPDNRLDGTSRIAAPNLGAGACEDFAAALRAWPIREVERSVQLSEQQRVAFYEFVTASLKAADTLVTACPAATALTPTRRMEAMLARLAAVRAATAAIRPALARFYEALDQGQKVRFAGMS